MDSPAAQTRSFLGAEKLQEYCGIDRIYIIKKNWDISGGTFLLLESELNY